MDDALKTDIDVGSLYDRDFAAWAFDQAGRLRGAAEGSPANGLDWLNLAEEIEGLARRDRRELASHIRTIVEHLMKLQMSPAVDPRPVWKNSVGNARREIELILDDSPSLRRDIAELLRRELPRARKAVEIAVSDYAETPIIPLASVRYTADQIISGWWPN